MFDLPWGGHTGHNTCKSRNYVTRLQHIMSRAAKGRPLLPADVDHQSLAGRAHSQDHRRVETAYAYPGSGMGAFEGKAVARHLTPTTEILSSHRLTECVGGEMSFVVFVHTFSVSLRHQPSVPAIMHLISYQIPLARRQQRQMALRTCRPQGRTL